MKCQIHAEVDLICFWIGAPLHYILCSSWTHFQVETWGGTRRTFYILSRYPWVGRAGVVWVGQIWPGPSKHGVLANSNPKTVSPPWRPQEARNNRIGHILSQNLWGLHNTKMPCFGDFKSIKTVTKYLPGEQWRWTKVISSNRLYDHQWCQKNGRPGGTSCRPRLPPHHLQNPRLPRLLGPAGPDFNHIHHKNKANQFLKRLQIKTKHRKNCECRPGHYLIVLITPQYHNSNLNHCLCSHCNHCSQCLLVSTSV